LGTIDRASPYLRTPVPVPRWSIQAKNITNHLQGLGNHEIIKKSTRVRPRTNYQDRNTPYGTNTRKNNFPIQFVFLARQASTNPIRPPSLLERKTNMKRGMKYPKLKR
jgi:hypothetical protein